MSLILFLFYWIVIPGAIIVAGVWLWRRNATTAAKAAVVAVCAAALGWFLWLAVGETWWVDQQVKALCAKDGGIKVFETVVLPPDKFDKWGNVGLHSKGYTKPTDEYYLESESQFLRKGNPKLLRSRYWVVRQNDGKVLGESIHYGRGAGGLPGPWHGSSFHCPEFLKENPNLETSVFIKADK